MINLLVDSRATGCFVKQELLPTGVLIQPCQQVWTVASMETLKVCRQVDLVLTIGTEVYWHKFNVIEGPFGYNTILGSNTLQQFGGKLNLGRG